MRKVTFLFVFIFIYSSISFSINKDFVIVHGLYTALHIIDYNQTLNVTKEGYNEINFILGKKPSKDKINLYFITVYIVNTSISTFLYKKNKNMWNLFMGFILGMKSTAVYYNFTVLKSF